MSDNNFLITDEADLQYISNVVKLILSKSGELSSVADFQGLCCQNFLRTEDLYQSDRIMQQLQKFERAYPTEA